MKIAYSGIEGAFAHIATRRIFPEQELQAFADRLERHREQMILLKEQIAGDIN